MEFENKTDDIVIRIPKKFYNKNVQELIDNVQYKKVLSKSKATQKDIDSIMGAIKKDRKKLMKPLFAKIGKLSK